MGAAMQLLALMVGVWFLHFVPALVLSAPIMHLGRNRVRLLFSDLLALVLPFSVWAGLFVADSGHKSLANLGECFFLAPAIAAAAFLRVVIGRGPREWIDSVFLLVALCGVSWFVYVATPRWPE